MVNLFEQLQDVFLNHDPALIDPKANNLLDEYDSEIYSLISVYDENGSLKDICDLAMCLDEIFEEAFSPLEVELKEDFVVAVADILGIQD